MSIVPASPSNNTHPSNTLHSTVNAPGMHAAGMPMQQGFDIWGPLQRRKYLIALFCLIGTALGYLYYSKTPPTYSSYTRLMITTHAPPAIVNGDYQMERGESIPKHVNLISSELVLNAAVESGSFEKMKSFDGEVFLVGLLKEKMLRVIPDSDSDETLTIVCNGPKAEELPKILNHIVNAYRQNLDDDSQNFGKEATELIEKLSYELTDEKNEAEKRSLELFAKLGVTEVNVGGNMVNPHIKRRNELSEEHDEIKSLLRKVTDRYQLLDSDFEKMGEDELKVVAIEAQEYLGLSRDDFEEKKGKDFLILEHETLRLPGMISRNDLEDRVWEFKTNLSNLMLEKSELSKTFGSGSRKMDALDKRVEFFRNELASMALDIQKYDDYQDKLDAEQAKLEQDEGGEGNLDLKTFRAQEDQRFIKLYRFALERERSRVSRDLAAGG